MFSSTSNFNPFQYTENPNSLIQEDNSSHFLHFPPAIPFLDDADLLLNEFLSQPHQQEQQVLVCDTNLVAETAQEVPATNSSKKITQNNKKKKNDIKAPKTLPVARKRSGKKDRHSKIYTAQGPRDRRMRLSLRIARKFFDLQDMLGFDKASKTIDWLFTKSKAAIKELADSVPRVKQCNSFSSTSESEVMSGSKTVTVGENGDKKEMVLTEDSSFLRLKQSKKPNKTAFNQESREKARARARERTKEKQKIKILDKSKQENPNNLGFTGKMAGEEQEEEEEEKGHDRNYFSQDQVDKFLGLTDAQKSSSIFDLSSRNDVVSNGADFKDEFSCFAGNWEISNGRGNYGNNRHCAIPNMKLLTTASCRNDFKRV
ncbi:transcription factor TCP12 isoform X1 [Jatropha curcas]|uniref:transcription factor TCP12 isoform X1 n=1 Tax=Jatropha curcas TaxID=180498 RepID=UPI0009D71973|nr:transcription factor TCP12 isoform X1 [Jatropha curcas]